MRVDAAINHYRNLLDRTWLRESIAWTVIIADDRPVEFQEIATMLAGGAPAEVWEDTPRMATERISSINHVIPVRAGSRINLIEPGVIHTNIDEFRRWMSSGRRIWSTSWHIKGGETLICAENDEILFGISEYFDTDRPFGADVAAAQHELDIMRQPSLFERKAAALAVMELHGGFRLSSEWLDSPQPVITIDRPIPLGAIPPSAFASAEPELAAQLRNASPAARRSFQIRLIERLADKYDLRIPQVTTILDHIRGDTHPTHRQWRDLAIETTYLSQDHWYGDPADAAPEWLRWQAAIAIRQGLRALDADARNTESLLSARNALHDTWEYLREEILALPRDSESPD
ncbi:hypothetical protein [Nonomuraea sp. CA-141351]|uniref:hypothetical protein n=1 Tax=Nonomuraea sp. CA-141351 TaxID=3239996 RepID=UPI003D8EE8A4